MEPIFLREIGLLTFPYRTHSFYLVTMNRSWPVHLISALFCFCISTTAMFAADASDSAYIAEGAASPGGSQDLIRASRAKYAEGSYLIKAGDSDKARESFNKAVDTLLQSDWDIPSTPDLNRYFQELVQKIQEDESRYLFATQDTTEGMETAVVDELGELDLVPATIDPSFQDVLTADLANIKYEIPITMNEMVAKSLDYWLNRGRKYFADGLVRSGQYRPMIERIFREESIPLDLMYLAQVESLFKPHAVSKAKAKGMWQFEKDTAIRYGLKVTRDVDERSDPEKSTRAAARYLNYLYDMFKDWNLALAAYNWGEGKVQRLINSTGLNDFWQLVDLRRKIPVETQNHVPLIQASVILGHNPEKFNLPTELAPPLKYLEVSISKPIDLRAAAKVLSTSFEELKKLNPALRGSTTPANYPNFQLKVPEDSDPGSHEQLASLPAAKVMLPREFDSRYKVRAGDTLSSIAAKYRLSVSELERANNISAKKKLTAGKWIQVPSRTTGKSSASPASSAKAKKAKSGKAASSKVGSAKEQGRTKSKSASLKNQIEPKSAVRQVASK
jgi:membrane-bound lytic murein transglycosylase D